MLAGGTAGMMTETFKTDVAESMALKMTKVTANMAVGMSLGNMAYNSLYSLGMTAYYHCHRTREEVKPLMSDQDIQAVNCVQQDHQTGKVAKDFQKLTPAM